MKRRRSDPFLRESPKRWRRVVRALAVLTLLVGLWFVAVDWSWFFEYCDDCLYQRDVCEYRVFGWAVYSYHVEHTSLIQLAAAKLDVPCPHGNYNRWHRYRFWGLCVCARPCLHVTTTMTGDESHWPSLLEELRVMAKDDPGFRDEFFQRVLVEHDYDCWKMVLGEVKCRLAAREQLGGGAE